MEGDKEEMILTDWNGDEASIAVLVYGCLVVKCVVSSSSGNFIGGNNECST